jgi:small subunit ribosomal protein S18
MKQPMTDDTSDQSRQNDYSRSKSGSGRRGGEMNRRSGSGPRTRRIEAPHRRQPPVKLENIEWKDVRTLRPFLNDVGRIRPRRKTGASLKMQRAIARAVKRARFMALLPYTAEHIRTTRQEE